MTGKYYIPRFWRVVGGHQTSVEPKDQEGMHACMHACMQAGRQAGRQAGVLGVQKVSFNDVYSN